MMQNSVKYQYYAAICVNMLSIWYGTICGWPSFSFLILQSNDSPLDDGPMSAEEASWVGSIMCIGGLTGNIFFGWLANVIGRKITMIIIVIPIVVSLALMALATNVEYLLVSRFLSGFAGGGVFCTVPLYVTEISEDKIRGILGSFLVLACNFGVLIAYIFGSYFDYQLFPYIMVIFPIIFLVFFIFLPETPPHLLKGNKITEAEKSLRYFRNLRKISKEPPEYFKYELEKLKHDYLDDQKKEGEEETPLSWSDFTTKPAMKSFFIGLALICLNQFSGCFAMINYTATIFVKSGSTLDPNTSAIIVGAIQLFGSYFSVVLVEKVGRKLLISGSAFGIGIGLLCMGTYLLLDMLPGYEVTDYNWIPLACFSFVIFIGSWGVITLPFLLLAEICPPKLRATILNINISILWILGFCMVKYLTILMDALGMHGVMFLFAACSFAGGMFVLGFVPETKGKSIDEIVAMLE